MNIEVKNESKTKVTLTISAGEAYLEPYKKAALEKLAPSVKAAGFRDGKAPLNVVEKNIDEQKLQSTFIDEALNQLYVIAANEKKIRPIDRPQISIKKFVPYSELEFEATVDVLGPIDLPDYKAVKKTIKKPTISDKEVNEVLENLATKQSEKKDVDRAAKNGDQVWIDFTGVDSKKEAIKGADGKDYPLALGSNTFIPGFEDKLVGAKKGDTKKFDLTFPKDYQAAGLANKKVTFTVKVNKVQEVVKPKIDDKFAKNAGPFTSLSSLKEDIKTQMLAEKAKKAQQDLEAEIVREISEKSKVDLPDSLVEDQVERLFGELKQSLTYRGQTVKEYLEQQGKTEEEFRKNDLKKEASDRVKAGLVLAEISEKEQIIVSPEELDERMKQLKSQYPDPKMQEELNKPEARHDISSRLLTEKTIKKLVEFAKKK